MTRTSPLVALGLVAVALVGCGVDTGSDLVRGEQARAERREVQARKDAEVRSARRNTLPSRPAGVANVSVELEDGITARAVRDLQDRGSSMTYRVTVEPTVAGFEALCNGRVDLLQANRRITADELEQCRANGLAVARPIAIAYSTSVVVTRNRTDPGGDCLTLLGLRELLRRGTPIRNWSQVGFADRPFEGMIPPAPSDIMQTIGVTVFGSEDGTLVLDDLRGDLRVTDDEDEIGAFVTAVDRLRALERDSRAYRDRYRRERRREATLTKRRMINAAAARVLEDIEAENRRRIRRRVAVRDPRALARRNRARVERAKRAAGREADRQEGLAVDRAVAQYRRTNLPNVFTGGRLGIVSYPYYEQHADVLRPLEVDPRRRDVTDAVPDCRFPSQETINNGSYPLSRAIYIYGDEQRIRTAAARTLLLHILDENTRLARVDELTGLSTAASNRVRRRLGLRVDPSSENRTTTTTTTTTTPDAGPTGIPGIGAPSADGSATTGTGTTTTTTTPAP
ncbi:MAG: hypothetical protein M0P31_10455 [Solirubrobacteraceae bacterium]|nr:hypothetical protein [Solirubrobacteraceae bacterium]